MCNKRYMYMFCTMDSFQVHPFIVDMIIKSDTSAKKKKKKKNYCASNILILMMLTYYMYVHVLGNGRIFGLQRGFVWMVIVDFDITPLSVIFQLYRSRKTRPVYSSARSGQLGPYVPDNSARSFNCLESRK